jgi:hypothetical protein
MVDDNQRPLLANRATTRRERPVTGIEVLQATLRQTQFVLNMLLEDLSDDDLLVRPVPDANHIAWQLGHLIVSENRLIAGEIASASVPQLPAGFAENHSKDAAAKTGRDGFSSKAEYVSLFNEFRAATIAEVGKLSDADFKRPTKGQMARMCPTLADLLMLVSNHTLLHGGQVSVVRRKLGKPVLF